MEMPVKSAGRILNENDKRLWRVLKAYVQEAYEKQDLSGVTQVGADELSYRKGHKYLTVFADMQDKWSSSQPSERISPLGLPSLRSFRSETDTLMPSLMRR
jgi:hypothetical protein